MGLRAPPVLSLDGAWWQLSPSWVGSTTGCLAGNSTGRSLLPVLNPGIQMSTGNENPLKVACLWQDGEMSPWERETDFPDCELGYKASFWGWQEKEPSMNAQTYQVKGKCIWHLWGSTLTLWVSPHPRAHDIKWQIKITKTGKSYLSLYL